jgi:O-antigen/teichoic acid export membrane protein
VAIGSAAQPQFVELFAMKAADRANALYRTTTAWLVILTWPLFLLVLVNGPKLLTIFGHSYKAGDTVLVILGLTMLLSMACGLVDVVLITAGRSSWSMVNGLLAMVVNVVLDVTLIPPYGITGAAIGWSAAIVVANLMPLTQLGLSYRLFPFGRGVVIACGLSTLSFCVVPLAARLLLGDHAAGILSGVAAGCVLMAAGLWYFRDALSISVMPGLSRLAARHGTGKG